MIRKHELPHWIIFWSVALLIVVTAFAVHPLAMSVVVLVIAVERFAEFIYQADQPGDSSVLKGNRQTHTT